MRHNRYRQAFTLIEVLIVVIIMAVLAATIIPQFSTATEDANTSQLEFNLHAMRAQIQMYRMHHNGNFPTLAKFPAQMTQPSNVDGGTTGDTPFGPYITDDIPANAYNGSKDLVAVAAAGVKPVTVVAGGAMILDFLHQLQLAGGKRGFLFHTRYAAAQLLQPGRFLPK